MDDVSLYNLIIDLASEHIRKVAFLRKPRPFLRGLTLHDIKEKQELLRVYGLNQMAARNSWFGIFGLKTVSIFPCGVSSHIYVLLSVDKKLEVIYAKINIDQTIYEVTKKIT